MTDTERRRTNSSHKNAIVLLQDGHPFKVGELTFGCKDSKHFSVIGWTVCNELKNLSKDKAQAELNETKDLFNKMIAVSQELSDFIKYRQVEYLLGFDYGMGRLEICSEKGGQIKWTAELEK